MLSYSELTKKFAPWSISKANLAKNCPLAFDFKYVRRIRGTARAKDSAARVGTAVHQVLELYLQQMDIKKATQRAFIDNELTTDEMDEVTSYTHNIVSFRKRLSEFKKRHKIKETQIEARFGMTADLKPTGFFDKNVFTRGVWDISMSDGKYVIIIDHKSGMCPSDTKEIFDRYGDQLKLYSIAALHKFPGIVGVQTAFHFVMSEEVVFSKMTTTSRVQKEYIPWYVQFLNECSQDIPTKEARPGWFCKFCEYATMCPRKKKQ